MFNFSAQVFAPSTSVFGQVPKWHMHQVQHYEQPAPQFTNYQVAEQQQHPQPAQYVANYIATLNELHKNGYAFRTGNGGVAFADTKYIKQKEAWLAESQDMRTCCRCNTFYSSSGNGNGTGLCRYHPKGKKLDQASGRLIRECCNEPLGQSAGCMVNTYHVTSQIPQSEKCKFIDTPKARGRFDTRSEQVYALDCEMVLTINGPALARLTVVDWDERPVLDCLVRPPTRVLDTVQEFSGLTMEDIERATDTLETCRRKLLNLVNEHTILVGHSLDSDLKALRLIHYNVVDTSLLFKSGEFKVGLKKLALEHLGLSIQSNNAQQFGHDSEEDARVSLQLLKFKMFNCL